MYNLGNVGNEKYLTVKLYQNGGTTMKDKQTQELKKENLSKDSLKKFKKKLAIEKKLLKLINGK